MVDETSALAAPPRKVDPESLVLRGRPRPVVRFRRGVVIGGVAAFSAGLITLTWLALEPVSFRRVAESGSGRPYEQAAPDSLAGAPRDYRDVPKLGPPLPGDLGRPILEQQREAAAAEPMPTAPEPTAPDRRAALAEQRAASEQAARTSSVIFQLAGGSAAGQKEVQSEPARSADAQTSARAAAGKPQLGDWAASDVNPHARMAPPSGFEIAAGSVIPASLVTGLNSDLPGMVVAQVTENVRDSATGRVVLIPQGARLLGRYDSATAYGQKRAFLVWQRILFPDGSSVRLDNMPASDSAGYAGLTDRVDGHSWQLIKGVVLSSILGVGSELSFGGEGGVVRAFRQSLQQNGSQAGGEIVSKGLGVQPTIRVRPGCPVRVLVSEDIVLPAWRG